MKVFSTSNVPLNDRLVNDYTRERGGGGKELKKTSGEEPIIRRGGRGFVAHVGSSSHVNSLSTFRSTTPEGLFQTENLRRDTTMNVYLNGNRNITRPDVLHRHRIPCRVLRGTGGSPSD